MSACRTCGVLESDTSRPKAKAEWQERVPAIVKGIDQHVALRLTRLFRANGTGYATDAAVAEDAGYTEKTVAKARGRLEDAGLLVAVKRHRGLHTDFRVMLPEWSSGTSDPNIQYEVPEVPVPGTGSIQYQVPANTQSINSKNDAQPSSPDRPDGRPAAGGLAGNGIKIRLAQQTQDGKPTGRWLMFVDSEADLDDDEDEIRHVERLGVAALAEATGRVIPAENGACVTGTREECDEWLPRVEAALARLNEGETQ